MSWMKFLGKLAPMGALALAVGVAGCDNISVNLGDEFDGKPLAELDLSGASPTDIALVGPDTVRIVNGTQFNITVAGNEDAKDRLRFNLDGDSFSIGRDQNGWSNDETATITITMPTPTNLALAGSGTLISDSLGGKAELNMMGSGTLNVTGIDADTLDVAIAGSGNIVASGATDTLDLSIMGSGEGDMAELTVGNADISIMGSGEATFASDGKVDASIMGSGTVTVRGAATCEVSSMGSGTVRCEAGNTRAADAPGVPDTPDAPDAPEAPAAPNTPDA